MSIRLKKIEIFKKPKPVHKWVFSWCDSVTIEQYQSERVFYTRACKEGRLVGNGTAQVPLAGSWRTEPVALPLETQLGEKLPSSSAAPGPWLQGQHCQNWGLVTKVPWRNQTDWGKDQAQTQRPSG